MRYLQSSPFSAQLGDKKAQQNYLDNYDRVFGKEQPDKPKPKKREAVSNEAVAAR